jgi:CBS domain-containing protein
MQVKDVMTANPACTTPETPLHEVARLMLDHDCGEIPVVESHERKVPVGVVTDRDIVCRVVANGQDPREARANDAMTTPAVTVTPDTSLEECSRIMEQKQIRRVPVVDGEGICGIVALADLARQAKPGLTTELIKEVSEPSRATSAGAR